MQADLAKERLGQHVQHLLKFGRDAFDSLQYNAVVADIKRPLLVNAGKPFPLRPTLLGPPPYPCAYHICLVPSTMQGLQEDSRQRAEVMLDIPGIT